MGDRHLRRLSPLCIGVIALGLIVSSTPAIIARTPGQTATTREPVPAGKPQPRKSGVRVPVTPQQIDVDDGDTVFIHWSVNDREDVRILGIDSPETQHLPHNIPYSQPFGQEARGFARRVGDGDEN